MNRPVIHKPAGLARPCSATDLFFIRGGMQCGNCLAHDLPENRDEQPTAPVVSVEVVG